MRHDGTGVEIPVPPGELMPEGYTKVQKKRQFVDGREILSDYREDRTRLIRSRLRKFRVMAHIIGKLKASQNLG